MAANFPTTPSVGDTHTVGELKYRWNGATWSPAPERINEKVNLLQPTSSSAVVDLSKGLYHKISPNYAGDFATTVTFVNIPETVTKWTVEFSHENFGFKMPAGYFTGSLILNTGIYLLSGFQIPSAISSVCNDFFINPSGNYWYATDDTNNRILMYAMPTRWNLTNSTFAGTFSVNAVDATPWGIHFSPDGTRMFFSGVSSFKIYSYTLSTPWMITTAVKDAAELVLTSTTIPRVFYFREDGLRLYAITGSGSTYNIVRSYILTTPWDLSTASASSTFSIATQETNGYSVYFNKLGTEMFVTGQSSDRTHRYTLSTAWNISTAAFAATSAATHASIGTYKHDPSGKFRYYSFIGQINPPLYLYYDVNAASITWPTNIIWNSDTPPVALPYQNIVVDFYTTDGGTNIYGVEKFNRSTQFD